MTSTPSIISISQKAAAYAERPVRFTGAGGVTLAGTLTLPTHRSVTRVAGMVLVAGSGPTDRDGNQGSAFHPDLLRRVAHFLAQQGIASLRYDKRGQYASGPAPTDPAQLADFVTWRNYVGDAAAALRWLQGQPAVDPARTGLLGHSEGGLIALQAARDLHGTGHAPALLVLVSTPGRPIDEVLREQLSSLLKRQGATPEQTRFFLDANARIVAAIERTGQVPKDVPPGLTALYPSYLGKFWQGELALRPPALAAQFPGPVLVLQGARDAQVSAQQDAPALDAALRRRAHDDHTLFIVPGASHNLKTMRGPDDPGLSGDIAPAALSHLRAWLGVRRPHGAGHACDRKVASLRGTATPRRFSASSGG